MITLLSFDEDNCKLIRGSVEPSMFGGIYREFSTRIYEYIDRYGKPPGEHLPDLFEKELTSEKKGVAGLYRDIIESVYEASDGINTVYVMNQLETFVRRQSLRSVTVELTRALNKDTEESIEEAYELITQATKQTLKVFEPGTRLGDKEKVLGFLNEENFAFPTGIPELDKRGFGPTRREMFLYMSDTKKGKSWLLIHLAKVALMHRLNVVHLTLEMDEGKVSKRYLQTFFGISKRKEKMYVTKFERDKQRQITGFEDREVTPRITFEDHDIEEQLGKRIDKWKTRILDNIVIKHFPAGTLTFPQYLAYLDNLEVTEKFVPDLVILDYPDLMKLHGDNPRFALDELYKNLRGAATARNHALAVVSQSNRLGAKAKTVDRTHAAEAYSKIQHADCAITYTQTQQEKALGLARLLVTAGRNDQDEITVVLSQNYAMGQYVIDSNLMNKSYWDEVKLASGEDELDEDED